MPHLANDGWLSMTSPCGCIFPPEAFQRFWPHSFTDLLCALWQVTQPLWVPCPHWHINSVCGRLCAVNCLFQSLPYPRGGPQGPRRVGALFGPPDQAAAEPALEPGLWLAWSRPLFSFPLALSTPWPAPLLPLCVHLELVTDFVPSANDLHVSGIGFPLVWPCPSWDPVAPHGLMRLRRGLPSSSIAHSALGGGPGRTRPGHLV